MQTSPGWLFPTTFRLWSKSCEPEYLLASAKAERCPNSSFAAISAGDPEATGELGSRVRLRRTLLGMSQQKLGDAIGLTFQQVQKYERGANRVGSSRLFDLARVLDVPVSYFFDEMSASTSARSPGRLRGMAEQKPLPFEPAPMAKRETLELVRAYYRITDSRVRKRGF